MEMGGENKSVRVVPSPTSSEGTVVFTGVSAERE